MRVFVIKTGINCSYHTLNFKPDYPTFAAQNTARFNFKQADINKKSRQYERCVKRSKKPY